MIEPLENGAAAAAIGENSTANLELTLSAIKEFLLMNGGKVKYADLYNRFRDLIIDSTTDDKFQEFVSNIAVKKYENESKDEWIVLKKKYMTSNGHSPPHMGFFASTLHKTKHNLTKFSNKAFNTSSSGGGKQTPPRSPLLNNNSINNNTSSGNLSISSSGSKQRSSSNSSSSSRRTSRNNSSNLVTMPRASISGAGVADTSSLSTSSLASSLDQFHAKSGHHSSERVSVARELARAFTPPLIFNHKSIDNLTMMDTSKLDRSTSRRSSSLILLDNTLVNTTVSSINNSTLVESPRTTTDTAISNSQEDDEEKKTAAATTKRLDQSVVVDHSTNIKSVKEHAKKLNRLNTESELKHLTDNMSNKLNKPQSTTNDFSDSSSQSSTASNKYVKIELDSIDISDPKPHEKEWIMLCARGNYHDLVSMLSKQPYLAQKKDPFTGYTCAHWACKHGNVEILKLLASTLENDTKTNPKSIRINHLINSRTRSGYTCLHIAYICNHSELVPYLKTYGALPIVDYNGKYGIEYSHNLINNTIIQSNTQLDMNDSKFGDTLNDANTFIKRSSSTIIASKQKSSKDEKEVGFLSMKETSGRNHHRAKLTTNMIESPFHRPNNNTKVVQNSSSPLNQRANNDSTTTNTVLMPPPKSTGVLKQHNEADDSRQDLTINEEESMGDCSSLRESKENLQFI